MGNTIGNHKNNKTKHLTIGLLAHVDAGKTTLAESMLYASGSIRKAGRVDHGDAFLDTYALEKDRGITIFAKQAQMTLGQYEVTLLDTPGHVDFSAEMERTLQVLDVAILIISGADGVQGHVQTLWRLLEHHQIPTFLFVNKMDQPGCEKDALLGELRERLGDACMDFTQDMETDAILENLAMCDEEVLEQYLETGKVWDTDVCRMIRQRKLFPCYFGSALKQEGIGELLKGLARYMEPPEYPQQFGARVFKIARDAKGERLTYLKITGGSLPVKTEVVKYNGTVAGSVNESPEPEAKSGEKIPFLNEIKGKDTEVSNERLKYKTTFSGKKSENRNTTSQAKAEQPQILWKEKVNQIRIYSGSSFQMVNEATAGSICAVTGLTQTKCGQGLGFEQDEMESLLEPVLTYQIILPEECDVHQTWLKLKQLEEEDPQLHIVWNEQVNEIHARVMGAVQIEILKDLIQERFDLSVEFGSGSIVYRESIADTVEGIGHFEPLRHYAEVHLLLEPGARGSGLAFACDCSEDVLDKNWQRLIMTHLLEKTHHGVLTGSEITDMKITLKSGRAHQKHTEGGDFRQATYRAVRQGLRQAQSVLLEPWYAFRLEVPSEQVGRAMSDIQRMEGSFETPQTMGNLAVLTGKAPVVAMQDYQMEVISYTRGVGRLSCSLCGYEPCHNTEEVLELIGYDPDQDLENPCGSVFCSHGAGYNVPWDEVTEHMHLPSVLKVEKEDIPQTGPIEAARLAGSPRSSWQMEKELQEIFERTYGKGSTQQRRSQYARTVSHNYSRPEYRTGQTKKGEKEYFLVDGYNIIFAWEDLKELASENIEAARNKLMDIMCNYQGYKGVTLILVYDAYKVKGNPGEIFRYHNIHVVYTKEAETADQYIEKTVHEIGRKYNVTVATSDGLEQVIILGQGAQRMSAQGLLEDVEMMNQEIRREHLSKVSETGQYLFENLPEHLQHDMEKVRLGEKEFHEVENKLKNKNL